MGKGEECICAYLCVCVVCFPMVEMYPIEKNAVSEKEENDDQRVMASPFNCDGCLTDSFPLYPTVRIIILLKNSE